MDDIVGLSDQIQDDLHLHHGLVQRKLSRMPKKPHRTVVQFRILPEPPREKIIKFSEYLRRKENTKSLCGKEKILPNREDMFYLELGYGDPYSAVVGRVAKKLHVDHTRIRLARHSCYKNKGNLISRNFNGCLFNLLLSSSRMCNVLYYKVIFDQSKQEHFKTDDANQAVDLACEALRHLVNSKDESELVHACCSLAVLSGCDNAGVTELIRRSDIHHRLLELIGHRTLSVAALRTLGNILEGNTCLIDWCIGSGKILDSLQVCLADDYVEIRREACWIISYITAEKGRWIQHVCDTGLIEDLVDVVLKDEFVVMEAAVQAISNAASGATIEQIRFMLSRGCIEPLCYLFYSRNSDIFNACLEGLEHIFKAGADVVNPYMERIEGWTSLKRSVHIYEEELFKKAHELMVKYGAMSPDEYKQCLDFRNRYDDD